MTSIKHIPLHPARPGTPLEGIYLSLWQAFAEQRHDEWLAIFRDCPFAPRQRAASVAASFMVFMGCNGGRGFTQRAESLVRTSEFSFAQVAYLAAWALENSRCRGVNSGLRCVEYMLAGEHPIHSAGHQNGQVNWAAVPQVTMEDLDVIECMVVWWASAAARTMREEAAALLAAQQACAVSGVWRLDANDGMRFPQECDLMGGATDCANGH